VVARIGGYATDPSLAFGQGKGNFGLRPANSMNAAHKWGTAEQTTVLHAVRKITGLVTTDGSLSEEIELLKRMLLE
jgi:hypothetical protein